MPADWLQNIWNIQQHVKETVTTTPDLSSQDREKESLR